MLVMNPGYRTCVSVCGLMLMVKTCVCLSMCARSFRVLMPSPAQVWHEGGAYLGAPRLDVVWCAVSSVQ
jgi:hypothetical protein